MLFSCQFVIILPILSFFSVDIGPIPEVVLVLQMQLWLCYRKSSLNSNPTETQKFIIFFLSIVLEELNSNFLLGF
jgi:hypothetical protein